MDTGKIQQVIDSPNTNTRRRKSRYFLPIMRVKTCFGLRLKTASFFIGYFQICGEVISGVLLRTGVDPLGHRDASGAQTSYITGIFWFFILNFILIVGLHTEMLLLLRVYYVVQLAHVVLGSLLALVLLSLVNFLLGLMMCVTLLILFFYVVVIRSTCLYLDQKKQLMKARQEARDRDNPRRLQNSRDSAASQQSRASSVLPSSGKPDSRYISVKK